MMADTENRNKFLIGLEKLEESSQSGWNRFARFIVIITVSLIVILLLIAAFTVWS